MKSFILTLLTCAFTAAIASAEDKPKDEANAPDAPAPVKVADMPDLTGTSWTLKSWSDQKTFDPTKFGFPAHFIMRGGRSLFHGDASTNGYSADYEAKADGSFSVKSIVVKLRQPGDGVELYWSLLKQVRKHAVDGECPWFS